MVIVPEDVRTTPSGDMLERSPIATSPMTYANSPTTAAVCILSAGNIHVARLDLTTMLSDLLFDRLRAIAVDAGRGDINATSGQDRLYTPAEATGSPGDHSDLAYELTNENGEHPSKYRPSTARRCAIW